MVKFRFESEDRQKSFGEISFSSTANFSVVVSVIEAVCRELGCIATVTVMI